mmetsp:Transcript_39513/g.156937  ORF Transcript_39513/g.156937 Transcript_39513/m.156937 type:complete len:83 (+) Transcript_39513:2150-2398(+)
MQPLPPIQPSRFEVTAIEAPKEGLPSREKSQEMVVEPVLSKGDGSESLAPAAPAQGDKEPTKMSRKVGHHLIRAFSHVRAQL